MTPFYLDRLVSSLANPSLDLSLNAGEALFDHVHIVPDSDTMCVILPSWKGLYDYTAFLRKKIIKKKQSLVECNLQPHILQGREQVPVHFASVKEQVLNTVGELQKQYSFKRINIIGISLGCVPALMIARYVSNLSKVVLVCPGADLAESMWKGVRTRDIKETLLGQGVDLSTIKDLWKDLAPENNLAGLWGKELSIYLSKADMVIPYKIGKRLVDKMIEKNLNIRVKINNYWGHYGTIMKYLLFPSV